MRSPPAIDVVLDETFWRPDDRRPDAAVELALDAGALPAGAWTPVANPLGHRRRKRPRQWAEPSAPFPSGAGVWA